MNDLGKQDGWERLPDLKKRACKRHGGRKRTHQVVSEKDERGRREERWRDSWIGAGSQVSLGKEFGLYPGGKRSQLEVIIGVGKRGVA